MLTRMAILRDAAVVVVMLGLTVCVRKTAWRKIEKFLGVGERERDRWIWKVGYKKGQSRVLLERT